MYRDQFIHIMQIIKKISDRTDDLEKTLERGYELEGFLMDPISSELIKWLTCEMLDKEEWIYHWIYELEWGTRTDLQVTCNGQVVKLDRLEDLYAFLIQNRYVNEGPVEVYID